MREPDGFTKKIFPVEIVLSWQTENMVAQNSTLQKVDQKLSQVDHNIAQCDQRLLNI